MTRGPFKDGYIFNADVSLQTVLAYFYQADQKLVLGNDGYTIEDLISDLEHILGEMRSSDE
jgi:hypothetical protein